VARADRGAPDALDVAVRALRSRDRSASELAARMDERGVTPAARDDALERLRSLGYVDDARYARSRAAALAARGAGDRLIVDDLERRGVAAELVQDAVALLEPELRRANAVVARRGASMGTVRYLAAKGFGEDVIEGVVAALPGDRLG
jgi:regulatory protein